MLWFIKVGNCKKGKLFLFIKQTSRSATRARGKKPNTPNFLQVIKPDNKQIKLSYPK